MYRMWFIHIHWPNLIPVCKSSIYTTRVSCELQNYFKEQGASGAVQTSLFLCFQIYRLCSSDGGRGLTWNALSPDSSLSGRRGRKSWKDCHHRTTRLWESCDRPGSCRFIESNVAVIKLCVYLAGWLTHTGRHLWCCLGNREGGSWACTDLWHSRLGKLHPSFPCFNATPHTCWHCSCSTGPMLTSRSTICSLLMDLFWCMRSLPRLPLIWFPQYGRK